MGQAKSICVAELGRTPYGACWELQQDLFVRRAEGLVGDLLLLTEHDHVYTIGTGGTDLHLLAGEEELRTRGVAVFHNDRGGDITYHGPGQIVGYPILDLQSYGADLHLYLRNLEEAVIRTLGSFGVRAGRVDGYTGVWAEGEKVCAIGIKSRRWITMHGFALNVSTDLAYFGRIIPCGIFEKGVTSLSRLLGRPVETGEVLPLLVREFGAVFGAEMTKAGAEELRAAAHSKEQPTDT